MKTDPISGNEIPPGVGATNVRDDIPANLSEGEYVFSADVVKFYGLDKLESMVNKAKDGMANLVKEDRIKDSEPELGTGMADPNTSIEEDINNLAEGGLVDQVQINGLVDKVKEAVKADPSLHQSLNDLGVNFAEGGAVDKKKVFNPSTWSVPGGTYFDPANVGWDQITEYRIYVDADGNRISIPFKGGDPQISIPEGYVPENGAASQDSTTEDIKKRDPTDRGDPPGSGVTGGLDYTTLSNDRLKEIVDGADQGIFRGALSGLNGILGNTFIGKFMENIHQSHVDKARKELATRGSSNNAGRRTVKDVSSPKGPGVNETDKQDPRRGFDSKSVPGRTRGNYGDRPNPGNPHSGGSTGRDPRSGFMSVATPGVSRGSQTNTRGSQTDKGYTGNDSVEFGRGTAPGLSGRGYAYNKGGFVTKKK